MIVLVLYVIPAFILQALAGDLNFLFVWATLLYYGFIAGLFLFLRKGHILLVTNALMFAGFVKSLEYFLIAEAFVFYIHISLALLITGAIHVRKYQLYTGYILFNGLIILRIPYVAHLISAGLLNSAALEESIQAVFGSLFITFTIHFLAGIIDREIEKSSRLVKMATTDTLTGLANRRKLEDYFSNSGVFGCKVLFVLDIDHFKKVNDEFGHKRGDEILVDFSSVFTTVLRDSDSCFRWGGEEFVGVLRGVTQEEAETICERLRREVEERDFGLGRPLTVSIGLTVCADGTEGLEPMLLRADKAMYRAKQNGRNRVETELP